MYAKLATALTVSLDLQQPPVAISFTGTIPAGIPTHSGRVPAGCRFWQDGATAAFATTAADHDLCAIGVYTHNLQPSPAQQSDLMDALKVFGDLDYVRPEDLASIPVLASQPAYVVYAPLASSSLHPDVVLLFVNPSQILILSEATQQVENQNRPSHGPASLRRSAPGHEHRPCGPQPWLLWSPRLSRSPLRRRGNLRHSRSQARSLHPPDRDPG